MFKYKRALQSHSFALLIISAFITLILSFGINTIYSDDNKACDSVIMKVGNICKQGISMRYIVQNKGERDFYLMINNQEDINKIISNKVMVGENKQFSTVFKDDSEIKISAIIKDGSKLNICSSIVKRIDTNVGKKC